MRKNILLLLIITALTTGLAAQEGTTRPLSDSAYAALITCGQGDEYYLSWGHSAIRICDTARGIDLAYNYGTFDFDTPHFYWKFCRGNLDYCLSRTRFSLFLSEYAFEGRAVWEQRLRLSPQEVNNLFVLLETNYQPEYRYYKYDFFRDNCATRVRDIVAASLDHRVLSPEVTLPDAKTYRDYLYEPTEKTRLWWRLGVDITLGIRCDHLCSNYQTMFSPIEMMHTFDTLTVSDTKEPIADPATELLADIREPLSPSTSPTLVFWGLFFFMAALSYVGLRQGWRLAAVDRILYIAPALISVVVIFLWFFTAHYCTKYNLNILWASPLFIYLAIGTTKSNRWVVWVQVVMLLAAIFFCFYPHPQRLNANIVPIALTLALRLVAGLYRSEDKE